MKKHLAFLAALFGASAAVVAADAAKSNYPLTVCAVSGEQLGSMGDPFDYIYQEAGKPDRLVRMCCKGCLKTFNKNPAKYLARIDAAAQGQAPTTAAEPATSEADADAVAKAKKNYPLKTCIVSDEPLGSLDEAAGYVHREAGKPERVVFFCCEGCGDDFKKEPAKYLAKLDEAAKAGSGEKK